MVQAWVLSQLLILPANCARIGQLGLGRPVGASNRGTTKHIAVAAMTSVFQLFASIALSLPAFPAGEAAFAPLADRPDADALWTDALRTDALWADALDPSGPPLRITPPPAAPAASTMADPLGPGPLGVDSWYQVRIEQQVIIRINPHEPGRDALAPQVLPMQPMMQSLNPPRIGPQSLNPQLLNPRLQPKPSQSRVRERKTGRCMPAGGIAAVQPITDGRLMFYMRDRRMLAAGLEKACSARDFYLGFYMSKTSDGQLCVGRDAIHSRAGTTCKLKDVREFVPVE